MVLEETAKIPWTARRGIVIKSRRKVDAVKNNWGKEKRIGCFGIQSSFHRFDRGNDMKG